MLMTFIVQQNAVFVLQILKSLSQFQHQMTLPTRLNLWMLVTNGCSLLLSLLQTLFCEWIIWNEFTTQLSTQL